MPKLLWVGDSRRSNTGFGRVTDNVLTRLVREYGWTVANLGINDRGQPWSENSSFGTNAKEGEVPLWHTYPAMCGGDPLGFGMMAAAANDFEPDVIVLSADAWVARDYRQVLLEQLGPIAREIPTIAYFPVDGGGYDSAHVGWMKSPEGNPLPTTAPIIAATYTQYGADVVRAAGYEGDVHVIPLGVDTDVYKPMDSAFGTNDGKWEARQKLGLGEEWKNTFIILNANRNQPRKRIDLSIKAFAKFLAANRDADAVLWLHMGRDSRGGWNLPRLWLREIALNGLDPVKHLDRVRFEAPGFDSHNAPSEEVLRLLYCASDIGINTGTGEGWGYCQHEGAACGRPQIVGDHTSLKELWNFHGAQNVIETAETIVDPDLMIERYIIDTDRAAELIDTWHYRMVNNGNLATLWGAKFLARATEQQFLWPAIVQQWHDLLTDCVVKYPYKARFLARKAKEQARETAAPLHLPHRLHEIKEAQRAEDDE